MKFIWCQQRFIIHTSFLHPKPLHNGAMSSAAPGSIQSSVWMFQSTLGCSQSKLKFCSFYHFTRQYLLLMSNPTFSYAIPVFFLRGNIWLVHCWKVPPRSLEQIETVFSLELSRWCLTVFVRVFLKGGIIFFLFTQKAAGDCCCR